MKLSSLTNCLSLIRAKIDPEHIIKPETLHSTFDGPASIVMNLTNWSDKARLYVVITRSGH